MVNKGYSHEEASQKVREKFLNDLCGSNKDTHFYVGTIQAYPKTWVILGVLYPKKISIKHDKFKDQLSLI